MKKGFFLVIEGADAVGKATQTQLLYERAKQNGLRVAKTAFPRYDTPTGREIRENYLAGVYGGLDEVDTHFASTLYMFDRRDAQPWIERTLRRTDLLIADRYSTANVAYQAAKAFGQEREALIEWLWRFEHEGPLHHIQPNKILYLDLPNEVAQRSLETRADVMESVPDIYERDRPHQQRVREVFLELAKRDPAHWNVVPCMSQDGRRYTREELADIIWSEVAGFPQVTMTPPQIYFTAPIRGTVVAKEEAKRMGAVLREYGSILTEHVLRGDVQQWEAQQKDVNVYERDVEWLNHANVVVAEVTSPGSYGVGMEIRQATAELGIPVIAFFNEETKPRAEISRMITHNKGATLVPYNLQNLEEVVHTAMKSVMENLF